MATDSDFYGVLGVSASAPQEQIRSRYRELVREYHPDLHPGDARAAEMMEKVNAAYDILGNPEERKQYDEQLTASAATWQEPAGPQTYRQPTAGNGSGPQSTWNPQWGGAQDPREQQAEAEAMWEAMRSQERSRSGLFDDVWARVPSTESPNISGLAMVGRIVWAVIRVVIGILFIALRLLNTRVDDRNDFF
ncbi:MAG: J domain-containing protein [Candidatus Cryosericum sp.]